MSSLKLLIRIVGTTGGLTWQDDILHRAISDLWAAGGGTDAPPESQLAAAPAEAANPAAASPAASPAAPAKPAEAAKPAAEASKPTAAAAAPVTDKRAQKLTIGIPLDIGPLTIYSSDSKFDWMVELVYDKLFSPSPYAEQPLQALAESATQVDHSTWTVTLRDGVKWHDGQPFTADDVVFT